MKLAGWRSGMMFDMFLWSCCELRIMLAYFSIGREEVARATTGRMQNAGDNVLLSGGNRLHNRMAFPQSGR